MKFFTIFLIFCATLIADRFEPPREFEQFENLAPSRARDYASLAFLESRKGNIDQNRAIFYSLRSPKPSHISAFLAALRFRGDQSLNKLANCRAAPNSKLLEQSDECLSILINASRAEGIDYNARFKIALKIENINPNKAFILRAFNAKNIYEKSAENPEAFFRIALNTSDDFFKRHRNIEISPATIKKLQSDPRFGSFLARASHTNLKKDDKIFENFEAIDEEFLDSKAAFNFGIINIVRNNLDRAAKSFAIADIKALKRYDRDRALFWLYLVENDKKHLIKILQSNESNFYVICAREILDRPLPYVLLNAPARSNAKEIYTDKDFTNPFFWSDFAQMIAENDRAKMIGELAKMASDRAEPFRAAINFALAEHSNQPNYYLNPVPKHLEGLSAHQKSLALAIMRKESRFMESSISTSYAIGGMQMMPFLINAMLKQNHNKTLGVWDFFNIDVEMPYALKHIAWLETKVNNVLFVAYAYNGGHGFTKRAIENNKLFQKGDFEPFLSLELMPVEETREYGKAVLANYVIYRQIFNDPVQLSAILQSLYLRFD
ncbi:MAG: transglycosylase SLT domain-containing protein [Helicobacteraceae bacterium]|nr:transglycosylase SLT domain-containing protein [Helicobacteraceae bacterium]